MLQLVIALVFVLLSLTTVLNYRSLLIKKQSVVVYQRSLKEKAFLGGNTTSFVDLKLSEVVEADTKELYETCQQGILQIVATINHICGGNDPIRDWSWALQASQIPYDTLDSSDYTITSNGTISLPSLIELRNIPSGSFIANPDCFNGVDVRLLGAYLYSTYLRPLGCDRFKLDLNGVYKDSFHYSYYYHDILAR